jgi:hypothetical protein
LRTAPSTFSDNGIYEKLEKRFGLRSTIELIKWLDNESQDFIKLKDQIAQGKIFPTWFGTSFSGRALNLSSLVAHLAKLTVESDTQKSPQEVVTEFVDVIATKKVQIRITAYLNNTCLFPSQLNLKLPNGIVFRNLTNKELKEVCTTDFFCNQYLCPSSNRSVFEIDLESPLFLNHSYEQTIDPWEEPLNKINQAHAALHCFKQGTIPIKLIRTKILTPTIPMDYIDMPKSVTGFSAFNLSEEEMDQLNLFMSQCLSHCRSNLEIAKTGFVTLKIVIPQLMQLSTHLSALKLCLIQVMLQS